MAGRRLSQHLIKLCFAHQFSERLYTNSIPQFSQIYSTKQNSRPPKVPAHHLVELGIKWSVEIPQPLDSGRRYFWVYARFVEWWTPRHFPKDQVLFISGEELVRDPAAEMGRVQDFLGLKRIVSDKHFYFNETKGFPCLKKSEGSGNPHCLGKTKGRAHPEISPATIQRLRDFYRPFNAKFYQMVGRNFGWP